MDLCIATCPHSVAEVKPLHARKHNVEIRQKQIADRVQMHALTAALATRVVRTTEHEQKLADHLQVPEDSRVEGPQRSPLRMLQWSVGAFSKLGLAHSDCVSILVLDSR